MPLLSTLTSRQFTGIGIRAPEPPPLIAQYTGFSLNNTNYNEGATITALVTTENIPNGTTVGYTVTGISAGDLSSGITTGSITITNNSGSVQFTLSNDGLTEGTDTFTITLSSLDSAENITGNLSDSATITDTSNNPNTALWLDSNDNPTTVRTIIGATSMQINGVFAANPSVPRTIEGRTTGTRTTITAVTARTGTFIEVDDTGNSTNFVIGEQLNLANITYSVSPAANNVNEGSSLTFTVTTANIPDGFTLYWTVSRPEDFAVSSGSFTINNNAGTFTVTPTADSATEGAETFTVSIRSGSTSGTVVTTSSSVTINDTSTSSVSPTIISSYVTGTSASSAQTRAGITQSISFSGTQTQSLTAATNSAFATYPVTVEAWVYSSAAGGGILNLQNTSTGQSLLFFNSGISNSDRSAATTAQVNGTAWNTGSWQHIAFTMWSSTGSTTVADRVTYFVNGQANGTSAGGLLTLSSGPPNYTATNQTRLLLGMNQFGLASANNPFNGFISELRVSSGARYGTATGTNIFTPNVNTAFTADGTTLALIRAV